PPVAEPFELEGPVPVRGWPLCPRPGPRARPLRGVPRPADGRPIAGGLPRLGDPPRGGGRQRPSHEDRGPIPGWSSGLQSTALHGPPDIPDERPAFAVAGPDCRGPCGPSRGVGRPTLPRAVRPRSGTPGGDLVVPGLHVGHIPTPGSTGRRADPFFSTIGA